MHISILRSLNHVLLMTFLILSLPGLAFSADEEEEVVLSPTYVDLEPAFTLNYGDPRRSRYVQASITLRVIIKPAALDVTAHSDAIRHAIIIVFSKQTQENLASKKGRDQILEDLLVELKALMLEETGEALVDRVLFTAFVLQR